MESIIDEKQNSINETISDCLDQFQDEMKDKFAEKLQDMVMDLENVLTENIEKDLEEAKKEIEEKELEAKPIQLTEFIIATEKDKKKIKKTEYIKQTTVITARMTRDDGKKYTQDIQLKDEDFDYLVIEDAIESERDHMRERGEL
jgi:hypothetical protein